MTRREIAGCVAIGVLSWLLAVVFAAAFMSLVSCGGNRGQMCPKPKHPAIDNGGSSPGSLCEVRK